MVLRMNKVAIGVFALAVAGRGSYVMTAAVNAPNVSDATPTPETAPLVEVAIPVTFTEQQAMGQIAFEANCAVCHGVNAAGRVWRGASVWFIRFMNRRTTVMRRFREQLHLGVQAHHWPIGNMAAIKRANAR